MTPKYEITRIAHPKFPWMHRIRALRDVREDVRAGDLGGFVQSERNLSQEGTCWIADNAIAAEEACVSGHSLLSDNAWACGHAAIFDRAIVSGNAVLDGGVFVAAGRIRDHAYIGGNAEIFASRVTGEAPVISESASVYGEVRGRVEINGRTVILPGSKIDNPTTDIFHIYPERIVVKKPFGKKLCVLSPPMAEKGQQKQKSRFPSRWEER